MDENQRPAKFVPESMRAITATKIESISTTCPFFGITPLSTKFFKISGEATVRNESIITVRIKKKRRYLKG